MNRWRRRHAVESPVKPNVTSRPDSDLPRDLLWIITTGPASHKYIQSLIRDFVERKAFSRNAMMLVCNTSNVFINFNICYFFHCDLKIAF